MKKPVLAAPYAITTSSQRHQLQQQQQIAGRRIRKRRSSSSGFSSSSWSSFYLFLSCPSSSTTVLLTILTIIIPLSIVTIRLYSFRSWHETNNYEALILASSSAATTASSRVLDDEAPDYNNKIMPRAYEMWKRQQQLPCYPPEPNMFAKKLPAKEGFVFVKTYKTGSSTASGINLRIARNVAQRLQQRRQLVRQKDDDGKNMTKTFDICKSRFDHAPASKKYSKLIRDKSFLWTVVREPTKRFVSQFFHFMVTRRDYEPTLQNLRSYINEGYKIHINMVDHHYLNFLSLSGYQNDNDNNKNPAAPVDDAHVIINKIFNDYGFIAITERMDESAVALSMLLGIPLGDVLYLSAKEHGGYDDAGGGDLSRTCKVIQPSFLTPEMKLALESHEWQNKVKYDRMLYDVANRSLDITIDQTLGRDAFEKNLKIYKNALAEIRRRCSATTIFPCTGGIYHGENETDCLWNDSACGMDCIDNVAKELNLSVY